MHKQHSISTAQDLEKIEENPISPKDHAPGNGDSGLVANDRKELKLNVESLGLS